MNKVDRTGWSPGLWDDEPDEVVGKMQGFDIEARRSPMGNWCGYVDVPKDHPWYGKELDDILVDVHGGVTYCRRNGDKWRVGFDCAHYGDYYPSSSAHGFAPTEDQTYKDLLFVVSEIGGLVEQAKEAK